MDFCSTKYIYILQSLFFVAKQQTDQRNTLCMSCSIVTDLNSRNSCSHNIHQWLPVVPVCHTKIGAKWPERFGANHQLMEWIFSRLHGRYVTCQIEFLHQGTSINSSCPSCFFVAIVHDSPRNCKSLKMWRKWTLHQKNRKFQSVKQRKKCCQLRRQILTQLFLVTKIDKNLPDLTIQHCRYPCDQFHGSGIHILCSKHVGSTTSSTFCLSDHSVWLSWWDLATGGWVVLRWLGSWSYGKPTVSNHPSIIRSSPLKCCTKKNSAKKNCIQDQPWN